MDLERGIALADHGDEVVEDLNWLHKNPIQRCEGFSYSFNVVVLPFQKLKDSVVALSDLIESLFESVTIAIIFAISAENLLQVFLDSVELVHELFLVVLVELPQIIDFHFQLGNSSTTVCGLLFTVLSVFEFEGGGISLVELRF